VRSWRGTAPAAKAHQRRIREHWATVEPRPVATSLDGYTVEPITRDEALPLIERYEWLANIGRATVFAGLLSPSRELHGVACFGHGPSGTIRKLIGGPALCLERGACVHWAPKNAASFLISRATKLVFRLTGIARFFAYADPEAGEYGGVYQACGWSYLGQGLNGGARQRWRRQHLLPPGCDPGRPASWRSDRELRRKGRRLTLAQARRKGWVVATRSAKHVYAVCVGPKRREWRHSLPTMPYPAPHPALKRGSAPLGRGQ
jgi:hypothetical protein